jgi:hypothetical protein
MFLPIVEETLTKFYAGAATWEILHAKSVCEVFETPFPLF